MINYVTFRRIRTDEQFAVPAHQAHLLESQPDQFERVVYDNQPEPVPEPVPDPKPVTPKKKTANKKTEDSGD